MFLSVHHLLATIQTLIFLKGGQQLRDVQSPTSNLGYLETHSFMQFWISRFSFQMNNFEQSSFLSLSDHTKYTDTSLSICSQSSRPQDPISGTFMMFIQGESKFNFRRRSQSDMQLSALKEWESLAMLAGGSFTDVSVNRCPRANVFNSFWESFWEILVTDYRYENSCPAFTLHKKVSPTCLYRFLLFYHSFVYTRVKE